jgi:hypothetical protein
MTLLWPAAEWCIKGSSNGTIQVPAYLQDSTFMLRAAALLCLLGIVSGCGIVSTTVGAVTTVGSAAATVAGTAVDIVTYPISD